MKFTPPPGMVEIKPLEEETIIASAERRYERIGTVSKSNSYGISAGDIICFDDYAYRRFTYEDVDYHVVDTAHGGLWGILHHEPAGE